MFNIFVGHCFDHWIETVHIFPITDETKWIFLWTANRLQIAAWKAKYSYKWCPVDVLCTITSSSSINSLQSFFFLNSCDSLGCASWIFRSITKAEKQQQCGDDVSKKKKWFRYFQFYHLNATNFNIQFQTNSLNYRYLWCFISSKSINSIFGIEFSSVWCTSLDDSIVYGNCFRLYIARTLSYWLETKCQT